MGRYCNGMLASEARGSEGLSNGLRRKPIVDNGGDPASSGLLRECTFGTDRFKYEATRAYTKLLNLSSNRSTAESFSSQP